MAVRRNRAKIIGVWAGLWWLLLAGVWPLQAQPLPPSSGRAVFPVPYTHFSDQEPVTQVLLDFARQQGLRATVSSAVTGHMSGRFDQVPPEAFLGGLKSAFGVNWYIQGQTICFFHDSEWRSEVYSSRSGNADQLYAQLSRSAVVSPQLPLKPPGSKGLLVFEGPEPYLIQLRQAAMALEETQSQRQVMRVFKLNHALAGDTTVNSMNRTVTIPGVASILGAIMSGQPAPGSGSVQVSQDRATVGKLLGTGLAAQGGAPPAPNAPAAAAATPGGGSIMADTRLNAVIIYDFEDRMPHYEEVIAELDRPVHLVEIHAAIVDVDTDFKRELGITYQGADPNSGWGVGGELSSSGDSYDPFPEAGSPSGQGGILSTIYTRGDHFFIARVRALEENGEARMLGRPSVLTTDNMEATLENTTTYYIEVAGQEAVDLFKVESGTVLQVTPRIIENPDGSPPTIRLNITIQDDQDDSQGGMVAGSRMAIPPIKQTKINTQALIEAGQSLLIGGYYFEQKADSDSGLPVLKNIPVLGNLFKTSNQNTRMMERLVLITPRVIRLGETPLTPAHIDEPSFSRSPTQSDYEPRPPQAPGGCLRR